MREPKTNIHINLSKGDIKSLVNKTIMSPCRDSSSRVARQIEKFTTPFHIDSNLTISPKDKTQD